MPNPKAFYLGRFSIFLMLIQTPVYAEDAAATITIPTKTNSENTGTLPIDLTKIDIRAVGDTAYVGEWSKEETIDKQKPQGRASEGYIERRLSGMIILRSPHINIMNLEASLTRTCDKFASKSFQFAVTPYTVLEFAKWGFNVISLANNHSLDCIKPGARREIRPSLAIIRKQFPNIAFHGVSYQSDQLQNVAIQNINGIKVGMVSIKGWAVGAQQLIGNISNRKKIFAALQNAPVDVRILTFHGGEELSRIPTADNLKVIHEFIAEYNGDAVFAHHPHVMQGIELLKKKNGRAAVVFHSLGNFLHDGLSRSQDGMMGRIEVTKNGVLAESVQIFPLESSSFKPHPIKADQLLAAKTIISNSTDTIAKKPLRFELTRMPFTFNDINDPATGLGISMETPKLVGPINSIKPVNYSPNGTTGDIKVIDSTHN